MPKVKVKFDNSNLRVAMAKYAGALKKSLRDTIENSARQIALHAQKQTLIESQSNKKGTPGSANEALKKQTASLQKRIIPKDGTVKKAVKEGQAIEPGMRLPRKYLAVSMLQKAHMSEDEAKHYRDVAFKRQGEIASGWNATIVATERLRPPPKKPPVRTRKAEIPAIVRKQGEKHGTYSYNENGDTARATIKVHFKGNDFAHIADWAVSRTAVGIGGQADAFIKADFKKAKREAKKATR